MAPSPGLRLDPTAMSQDIVVKLPGPVVVGELAEEKRPVGWHHRRATVPEGAGRTASPGLGRAPRVFLECLGRPPGSRSVSSPATTRLVTIYWRPGCPYCSRLRRDLRAIGLPTSDINIW